MVMTAWAETVLARGGQCRKYQQVSADGYIVGGTRPIYAVSKFSTYITRKAAQGHAPDAVTIGNDKHSSHQRWS